MRTAVATENKATNVVPIGTTASEVLAIDRQIAQLNADAKGSDARRAALASAKADAMSRRDISREAFRSAQVAVNIGDATPTEVAKLSRALQDAEIAYQDALEAEIVEAQTGPARLAKIESMKKRRRDLVVPELRDQMEDYADRLHDLIEALDALGAEGKELAARAEKDARLFRATSGILRLDDRLPIELVGICRILSTPEVQKMITRAHSLLIKIDNRREKDGRE